MTEKTILLPGPDHPITIDANTGHLVVTAAGHTIADTASALTLREAAHPPVQYIPGSDVDFSLLERTDNYSYCPYKGDCSYYSIVGAGDAGINAVWTYENPYPAVAGIKGHVAFYADRVGGLEN